MSIPKALSKSYDKTIASFLVIMLAVLFLTPITETQLFDVKSKFSTGATWPYIKNWHNLDIEYPAYRTYSYPIQSEEIALCLSGGGYRAALFHTGVLARINEAGLLKNVKRIVGVSGGSFPAGVVGAHWKALEFNPLTGKADNFSDVITDRLIRLTQNTIDKPAVLQSFFPWASSSGYLSSKYDDYLFQGKTLQNLPDFSPDTASEMGPEVVILSTELRTRTQWVFTKYVMGSEKFGYLPYPDLSISTAVAASAAYPPFLAPINLRTNHRLYLRPKLAPTKATHIFENESIFVLFIDNSKEANEDNIARQKRIHGIDNIFTNETFERKIDEQPTKPWIDKLNKTIEKKRIAGDERLYNHWKFQVSELAESIYLVDGGVLSNTGLEYCANSKRFIISSASSLLNDLSSAPQNWLEQTIATTEAIHDRAEFSALQKYDKLINIHGCSPGENRNCGAMVTLGNKNHAGLIREAFPSASEFNRYLDVINIPTRLGAVEPEVQRKIINWGYVLGGLSLFHLGYTKSQDFDKGIPFPNDWPN